VRYGRLLDIGRQHVEAQVPRTLWHRLQRKALLLVLPNRPLFGLLLWLGRLFRPLLPAALRATVPPLHPAGVWPAPRHGRRMLLLQGCVQPAIAPNIDAAAARVLDRAGISLVYAPGAASCCGALAHHLSAEEMALEQARRNIDAWWPEIERGAEAVVVTASGCGTVVKDYTTLLREEPRYASKAATVSALFRDLSQVVAAEAAKLPRAATTRRIAVHSPCTLQHGLQVRGVVEGLLKDAGCTLLPVRDAHLCCGSAGTYSILQPGLSKQLRGTKLAALEASEPEQIVTANIGCLTHLGAGTARPVRHWIEVLDEALSLSS
jgi:glycolate oxidase iron-sulfur subunit